jgi:hypothetical protein
METGKGSVEARTRMIIRQSLALGNQTDLEKIQMSSLTWRALTPSLALMIWRYRGGRGEMWVKNCCKVQERGHPLYKSMLLHSDQSTCPSVTQVRPKRSCRSMSLDKRSTTPLA